MGGLTMPDCHFCDLYSWLKAHEDKAFKTEYEAALVVRYGFERFTYCNHKLRFCPSCGKRLGGKRSKGNYYGSKK